MPIRFKMIRPIPFIRRFSNTALRLDTLAFIESSKGTITPSSLSAVTAARALRKPITAIVLGPDGEKIAETASRINGVTNVLLAKGDQYNHYLAEELSPLFGETIKTKGFTHFVTPASAVGKSFLPRLGALLDVQPISDIIKVESDDTFVRPIYAGNALATVKSEDKTILVSVRASNFSPSEILEEGVSIEEINYPGKIVNRTKFVAEQLITSERPELASASRVISGGRGLQSKESFASLIEPLASKLNAGIGASRAAVDAGFCDNSLQVGQTGKVVAPELYIAVGISGAIQHLAGMKDSKTIVAINKDPDAPIFNVADIGLVQDLNEAIPELTEKL